MKKTITCPLDCYDLCLIDVEIEKGKIVKLEGNKEHPLTKGFICQKGRDHLKRHYDLQRLQTPMKKVNGKWIKISYDEAEEMVISRLDDYKNSQIIHYVDSGYSGISKEVDTMFFNNLGGVVTSRGSLCWAAGMTATNDSFSDVLSCDFEDLIDSDVVILWGRNPVDTNIHLSNLIMNEKNKGKRIILIDPLKTNSVALSTEHISIIPNTDHYLALGIIKYLYDLNLLDMKRIAKESSGWQELLNEIEGLSLKIVSSKTGISVDVIKNLANIYSSQKVMTYIGYGLQRYKTGGNVVKSINALSFATFNFGQKGRGINYANRGFSKLIDTYVNQSKSQVNSHETFIMSKFGEYVLSNDIRMLFVTKANPLVQLPNLQLVNKAFKKIEFKVGIDLFMTDTMNACDLIFPATSIFEEEDIFYSSMYSPYLQYSQKVVDNKSIKGEYELFKSLATKMKLKSYPMISKEEYLKDSIKKILKDNGLSYNDFKKKKYLRVFTGKQYNKMKLFKFSCKLTDISTSENYPFRLLTPHHKDSLHSQGFKDIKAKPNIYMSKKTFDSYVNSKNVVVESKYGKVSGIPIISDVPDNIIMIYEGYWKQSGEINNLTTDDYSDIGDQAAYYDTFVKVRGK